METDETVRTIIGGQVSEELAALGELPSEAEIGALIERYAGSRRVTAELADELLAGLGEVPVRQIDPKLAAREIEEVAGGSWLDKIGSGSSAPPRNAASSPNSSASAADARPRRPSLPPVLTITPVPPAPEPVAEVLSVQQGLERLPAATYSTMPPPSALLSQDSAPIALPLSSRPPLASLPPTAAETDSVLVEQWGQAAAPSSSSPAPLAARPSSRVPPLPMSVAPDASLSRSSTVPPLPRSFGPDAVAARSSSRVPPLPRSARPEVPSFPQTLPPAAVSAVPAASTPEEALLSAEEDALLDQWSDDLDKVLPSEAAPPVRPSDVVPGADEPEPWNAPEPAAAAAGEDDAPLSAAELSLLDSLSPAPDVPTLAKPESAITGGFAAADYAAAVYAPSDSHFPRARNRPQPLGQAGPRVSARPPALSVPPSRGFGVPEVASSTHVSAAPPALSARAAPMPTLPPPLPAAAADSGEAEDIELDVEEIELDPDDLIELDNES